MNSLRLGKTLLRPSRIELVILVVLVVLSLIIVNNSEATSKATWEVSRGIPFTVVVFDECRGPCTPVGFLCRWHCDKLFLCGPLAKYFVRNPCIFPGSFPRTSSS
jgi:hypothetical protein